MKKIKGNIIKLAKDGVFDVIIHGCNCHCTMGAGLAKQIKKEFPEAYQADLRTSPGDRSKLGSYSSVTIGGLTIVNGYTQYDFGVHQTNVSYDALETLFSKIKTDFSGKRIGYPAIGSGLGGGKWSIIEKIIDQELEGEDHTLIIFGN